MKNDYIHAVLDMLAEGKDPQKVLNGLKKSLEKKGYQRLYIPILQGLYRILQSKKDYEGTVVTVAREEDVQKYKDTIKTFLETDKKNTSEVQTHIDKKIIGGIIISDKEKTLDKSYKTALRNLYQTITKT